MLQWFVLRALLQSRLAMDLVPRLKLRICPMCKSSGVKEEVQPDADQWKLLRRVRDRCVLEEKEERFDRVSESPAEPLRYLVHGLPGSGKSKMILWLKVPYSINSCRACSAGNALSIVPASSLICQQV